MDNEIIKTKLLVTITDKGKEEKAKLLAHNGANCTV